MGDTRASDTPGNDVVKDMDLMSGCQQEKMEQRVRKQPAGAGRGAEGSWSCDGQQRGKTKRSQRRCTQGPCLGLLTELQIEVSVSQTSPEGLRSPLAASHQRVTMETNGASSGERSEDDHLLVRRMCLLSVEDMAFPADCE